MEANSFLDTPQALCTQTGLLFHNATKICAPYINSLQTCPSDPVDEQIRWQIVNQTAHCMAAVWVSYGNSTAYAGYTSEIGPPPSFGINKSCEYPDFIPIMEKTCSFDYSQLNYSCASIGNYIQAINQYSRCATESMLQYWRCSQQMSYDNVSSCVETNAVKIDWLPQIQPYSGASACPEPGEVLSRQIITLIFRFLLPLLGSVLLDMIKKRRRSSQTAQYRPPLCSQWRLETHFSLNPRRVFSSVGKELLTAYLSAIILQDTHTIGVFSTTNDFWGNFLFFTVRPRPAPLTGMLGLFARHSKNGLADLFADGMISWVASTNVLIAYWYIFVAPPTNPAAPLQALRILGIGAILSCVPSFFVLAVILLLSFCFRAGVGGILVFFGFLGIIALLLCLLPVIAVAEMIMNVVTKIRSMSSNKTGDIQQIDWFRREDSGFRKVYILMVISSTVINVGNWIFFSSFLKLQGNLYCPANFDKITAIWVFVPLGIDLVFYLFDILIHIEQS